MYNIYTTVLSDLSYRTASEKNTEKKNNNSLARMINYAYMLGVSFVNREKKYKRLKKKIYMNLDCWVANLY